MQDSSNFASLETTPLPVVAADSRFQGNFLVPKYQAATTIWGSSWQQYYEPQQLPGSIFASPNVSVITQVTDGNGWGVDVIKNMYCELDVTCNGSTADQYNLTEAINMLTEIDVYASQSQFFFQYYPPAMSLENKFNSNDSLLASTSIVENISTSTYLNGNTGSGQGLTGGNAYVYMCKIEEPFSGPKMLMSALNVPVSFKVYFNTSADAIQSGATLTLSQMRLHADGYVFAPIVREALIARASNNVQIMRYLFPRVQVVTASGGQSITANLQYNVNVGANQTGWAAAWRFYARPANATGENRYTSLPGAINTLTYFVNGQSKFLEINMPYQLLQYQIEPRNYPGACFSQQAYFELAFTTDPYESLRNGLSQGAHYVTSQDRFQFNSSSTFSTTNTEFVAIMYQYYELKQENGNLTGIAVGAPEV
jgi:hypothetical protein